MTKYRTAIVALLVLLGSIAGCSSASISKPAAIVDCHRPNMVIAVNILPGESAAYYRGFAAPGSQLNQAAAQLITIELNAVEEEKYETSIKTKGPKLDYCLARTLTKDKFLEMESTESRVTTSSSKKIQVDRGTPVLFYLSYSDSQPGPNSLWVPSPDELRNPSPPSTFPTA